MSIELSPIHLVVGDEALLVNETVTALVDAAFEGKGPGFNLASFDASEQALGAVDLARTQPMMARRRVVVVRELEKASVELLDALLDYAQNPNPSTVLVLCGTKLPEAKGGVNRGTRLSNQVKKVGQVQRFRSRDQDPATFAVDHAAAAGCSLDRRTAQLLVELTGSDLSRVRSEVDKAIAYVGGEGAIDSGVVEQVSSLVGEAAVWDLTDAIVSRNADRGLAAMHRMLEAAGSGDRVSYRLLSLVTWQIRQLLVLQESLLLGEDTPESWRRIPRSKRQAAEGLLRRRPLSAERMLGALARANRAFNRARAGDRRIFEALVMDLVAP